jgi:hypothetical protein
MTVVSKGTVLQMDVAGSLAAVAEVLSIEVSGAKSETFDATVLNQNTSGMARHATGFSTPPDVSLEYFYLPANAGHQAMTDEITTPTTVVANQLDGKVIYADTAATEMPFKIAGIEVGVTVAKDDGLKGSATFTLNGQPTWPT